MTADPDQLAESVVDAALATPGVARMHPGQYGEAATYLPGRRVVGVQLRDNHVEVHVTVAWGADLPTTVDRLRAEVGGIAHRAVHVVVEDVVDPSGTSGPSVA